MGFDFTTHPLIEVCNFIDYRGKTPPKTTSGIPLITAKIIKNGYILEPSEFISPDFYDEWIRRGIPQKGSVVFTTEAPLGEVGKIQTDEKVAFAQQVIILEPILDLLYGDYLLYALQDYLLKSRIEAKATGTTVIGIKSSELKKVLIDLPPLPEQKAIADTLSILDRNIELNNQANQVLEEMAQAIFKSWFVDFESFGGEMPEDWEIGTLSDVCSYSNTKIELTLLNKDTYISTENMLPYKKGVTFSSGLPESKSTTEFQVSDILTSNIRSYFQKIYFADFNGGCSADVMCFRANNKKLAPYLYNCLYNDNFFIYVMTGVKGTKMPRGDKKQIMNYPVILPNEKIIEFSEITSSFLAQISKNNAENKTLTEIRNTLLPKLMSGEVRVPFKEEK